MDSLPIILRSYANDLEAAGPAYAIMAHYIREAARRLDVPPPNPVRDPVLDGEILGYGPAPRCEVCED